MHNGSPVGTLVSLESKLREKQPHGCRKTVEILLRCLDRRYIAHFYQRLRVGYCLHVAYVVLLARILGSKSEEGVCNVRGLETLFSFEQLSRCAEYSFESLYTCGAIDK